ncbi:hypothetical protein [Subtercola sp. RTI3]|uniref:hypothetical protein n=1 Tax=Subtercola sp. RTI3 TaxID=3048639 RepID=UPI002B22D674|nr:hypothetical protein [Subtercola sp. RTI3]MEA9986077.1 hypothetical protein [Subtercola sp. RTI3]
MGAIKAVSVTAAVAVVALFVGMLGVGGQSASAACGGSNVNPATAAQAGTVAGFSGDQLTNAAYIMNAAVTLGMDTQAETIGVMVAIGEHGLNNEATGDGAINPDGTVADSIGLFQQQHTWGNYADRMDPFKSATLFFQRLKNLPGWESMTPTTAAHAIQVNADPNYYTPFFTKAAAIVQALSSTSGAGSCGVGGDAVALAQELVTAADNGNLVGSVPDHIKEIRWIAQGKAMPDCGIDTRILQVMVIALHTFGKIGVSDINRKCTGQIEGAGLLSAHYANGGGQAIDFYSLGGTSTNGADANALRLIAVLDPIMPKDAGLGQSECRAAAGDEPALTNFSDFNDSCTHVHIDVGHVTGQLKTGQTTN